MSDHTREARAKADLRFERMQRLADEEARLKAEREAVAKALDDKTAKLRAQRIAKQRADTQPLRTED